MRTTVRLPEDLLKRAKRKAAADGRTLTELIEEGLRSVLSAPRGAPKKKRARVSRATGGLMPELAGIDPTKLPTVLEEIEDIERMQRIERGA